MESPRPAADTPTPEPAAEPSPAMPSLSLGPGPEVASSLEQRVRRLEDTVKEMQSLHVTDRLPDEPPAPLKLVVPDVSLPPPPADPNPAAAPAPPPEKRWLLSEMLAEARAIQFMFFDPRYTMSWGGRFFPVVLLLAFVTTSWWLPLDKLPGIGWVLQKCVELVLGFALFKVLGHEARRYREMAPELPPWLRL